ncbi:MAG: tRNA (adenosine(37)-N6)-dimethylallyltransferase MiaA [Acidobacteriota bacterium]
MSAPLPLVVVVGPTAVGKSALALELADRCEGAIVSADAMQVYRGFDRGTAKPTPAERRRVPHFLVDVVDPRDDFSAGDFVRAAETAITEIRGTGRRPFLVGGSGLYVRSLLRGLFHGPRRHPGLRRRLGAIRDRRGPEFLHRMLERLDPVAARRVGPRDVQRIVRALEVLLVSGRSLSDHLDAQAGQGWRGKDRVACVKIGLACDRDELRRRIGSRVLRFFAAGLVEEVRGLVASGIPARANAFKAIGYRQALEVVEGRMSEQEAIESTTRATIRYARRQMTWFRREENVHWLRVGLQPDSTLRAALALV